MFKKIYLIGLFMVLAKLSMACSCNMPNIFLEFYASKYVFYGEIISKTYPQDSLTYTFTFKIEKHYKGNDHPKTLSFTWPSEARYRNVGWSSCDYNVSIGDKILVFAKEKDGKLGFGLNCSNSSLTGLSIYNIDKLKHANKFNILNYHINFDYVLFNKTIPITNVDSLIAPLKTRTFEKSNNVVIMFDVDTNGNITNSNFRNAKNPEFNRPDSAIFMYDVVNRKYREPKNEFEEVVLSVANKIKKWEVMKFKNINQSVNSRQYISFSVDQTNHIVWSQTYFPFF